jgi:hypothetical protein
MRNNFLKRSKEMINYSAFKAHESVIGKLPIIPLNLTSSLLTQNVGEYVDYRGLILRWSGFMSVPDSEKIICRWQCYFKLADETKNQIVGLMALNTGFSGFYTQGERFDLTVELGFARYCYLEELLKYPENIQRAKETTLQMLKAAIDFNWDIILSN